MEYSDIIALGGLVVALVGIITGFYLQRDLKKVRELERQNKKLKGRLKKSLNAIKGYQLIEEDQAKELNKNLSVYRREIREKYSEYFHSSFLTPGNIEEKIQEIDEE